ncbi:hypothetical protein EDB86DRAFT_2769787, partial [Lactarius hatsudake]
AQIDNYILQARRKSGRQTEKSVLSLWKQWVPSAITAGVIPDVIVDADHSMAYLKYAATRRLLTTTGQDQHNSQRLSSVSDFDVSENTILDSQLFPEHFEQVTRSIFTRLDQLPSIIKAHFSWTWQCTTLNRGDELVNLLLNCLQPYRLSVPEHMPINGRRPGKREPDYNFVLPHREPLRCSIGALAILLHFVFDQEGLCAKIPGWDWSCPSTWRKVHGVLQRVTLMFGKTVGNPCSPDTLRKMYKTFLGATTIKSNKKLHLARRTMPTVLEEMGVTMDEIDGIGHWASNTRREAVVALAGFYVGEAYHVPWAQIPVPGRLQTALFPFVENALANLKAGSRVNQGVVNFLELLQQLRPFFWRVCGAIHERFPECSLFRRMKVFTCPGAKEFLDAWPGLVSGMEHEIEEETIIASTFSEA